jgi:hypothetical protein
LLCGRWVFCRGWGGGGNIESVRVQVNPAFPQNNGIRFFVSPVRLQNAVFGDFTRVHVRHPCLGSVRFFRDPMLRLQIF